MKKKLKYLIVFALICLAAPRVSAQQHLVYNHYFLNPSLYNPSFIAPRGHSELYLNYRKQWSGIAGAPTSGTLNLHLPLSYKTGIAFTAFHDKAGLLTTSTGLLSFAYQVYFGKKITDLNRLSFGMSAGITNTRIDADKAPDLNDPVLTNGTSALDGQFGINYQYNGFRLAFAIPRLFDSYVAAEERFNVGVLNQVRNTIGSISYEFNLSPQLTFEPYVMYRTYQNLDGQYELLGSLKFKNMLWAGGSYRQDYGAAAFFGFTINERINLGYAYEFATQQSDRIGQGSHEFQLILKIGKKDFKRPDPVKKSTAQHHPGNIAATNTAAAHEPVKEEEPVAEEPAKVAAEQKQRVAETPTVQPDQQNAEPVEPATLQVTKLNGEGLAPGHYVVVGAFNSVVNAKNYAATLKRSGYPASVAFHPERGHYIVHMINAPTLQQAKVLRDKYRAMSRYSFRDTWILTID